MIGTPAVVILVLAQLFGGIIVALLVTSVVIRGARQRIESRRARADVRAAQLIMAALDGGAAQAEATLVRHALGRRLDAAIVALVPKLRGADREGLVQLLRRRGVVEAARRGTTSIRSIRRLRSVELLGALGLAECVPELTARLHDRNPDVRRAAVRALGRTASPDAVAHLLNLVGREKHPVAEHSLTLALVRIGPAGVPALTVALEGTVPRVAAAAAHVLGWLGDHSAVPALSRAAAHDDERVAVAALEALGRMDSPAAEAPLRSRLSADEDPQVRLSATRALGRLGHPGSVDALAGLLGEEHELARAAAVSLRRLGTAGRDALAASAGTVPEAMEALGRDGPALAGSTRGA